jgi:hypothetical protein
MIQPFYTTDTVAGHLARSFNRVLRFNAQESVFQELRGSWVNIDDAGFERYARDSINMLLGHAWRVSEEAVNELQDMSRSDLALYEIRVKAAEMLSYTEPGPAPEADAEEVAQ